MLDDPDALDVVGHGTACAGIIHGIAPGADIVSVRVLGPDNRGKGIVFAAGLDWAIEQGASVVNLSLSSKSDALFGLFHDLADRAYFANVLLVCAANNVPGNSYPSLFASVVSVAAHDVADAGAWFYNPDPPVEFGAYGVDVEVAWRDGGRMIATGNSFAAPHVAGYATLIRAAHPTGVAVRGEGDPRRDGVGAAGPVAARPAGTGLRPTRPGGGPAVQRPTAGSAPGRAPGCRCRRPASAACQPSCAALAGPGLVPHRVRRVRTAPMRQPGGRDP